MEEKKRQYEEGGIVAEAKGTVVGEATGRT